MIYIFWTCKDESEAILVAEKLLEKKLIACANIFPEITSIYRWDGKLCTSKETKVIFKTLATYFDLVSAEIKDLCSYKVPEISQISIEKLNPSYLQWLTAECISTKVATLPSL